MAPNMYPRDPPDWKGKFPALRRRKIFPFLELPSELRAEIYKLLLGGNTIHIDFPGCQEAKHFIDGQPFLCQASISDAESFAQHGWEPKRPPSRLFFSTRHSKCKEGKGVSGLPLWVLRICKEVYQEACLIPFQENCFTFAAPQSVQNFIERLDDFQVAAISHVMVFQTSTMTMWDAPKITEPPNFPKLLNIRHLTIFIELCPANFKHKTKDGHPDGETVTSVQVQDRLIARMLKLWSQKLERVEVLINNTEVPVSNEAFGYSGPLTAENVEAWTARIKRVMPLTADADELDNELDALAGDD